MLHQFKTSRHVRPRLEALEDRTLLSTCTVTRLTDDGSGSGFAGDLRYCLSQSEVDAINISVAGTINLLRVLPPLASDLTIQGSGANVLTVRRSAGAFFRIFMIASRATVSISGLTITNGGGECGGGIFNSGFLTLSSSNIAGNSGSSCAGGGIYNAGTMTVFGSTVVNNSATFGGGIWNEGPLTVINSTITGNSAANGGGILNNGSSTLSVIGSTIAGNSARSIGGGIYENGGLLDARNTIIAGNTAPGGPDLLGNLGSLGHNLVGNTSGGSGFHESDLLNVDPLLGPLQANGGPTPTMAPGPGSPAVDAGDNTDALATDQRGLGFPRIVADTIDIGTFEVQPGPATWFRLDTPAQVASGARFDVTVYALDDYGHLATGYTGTVAFFTTDKDTGVVLPVDYTFTDADRGVHAFADETVLITPGDQFLWAVDAEGGISGEVAVRVEPVAGPAAGGGWLPVVPDGNLAAAHLLFAHIHQWEQSDRLWAALPTLPKGKRYDLLPAVTP